MNYETAYLTQFERQTIYCDTTIGAFAVLRFSWKKLCRSAYLLLPRIAETLDYECWGLGIVFFKNAEGNNYKYSLYIQILCVNILINFK